MIARLAALASRAQRSLPLRTVVLLGLAALATIVFVEIAEEVLEGNADPIDRSIELAIHRIDSPMLDEIMTTTTFFGSWPPIVLVVAVVAGWSLYRGRRRVAFVLVANAVVIVALNRLLKAVFARPRPELFDEILRPKDYSFPSGHAMESMAIYGAIAAVVITLRPALRWPVIVTSAILIASIGFSRVYLGVHWPSDVLAGYAAGVPPLIVTIWQLRAIRTRPGTTAPRLSDPTEVHSS